MPIRMGLQPYSSRITMPIGTETGSRNRRFASQNRLSHAKTTGLAPQMAAISRSIRKELVTKEAVIRS